MRLAAVLALLVSTLSLAPNVHGLGAQQRTSDDRQFIDIGGLRRWYVVRVPLRTTRTSPPVPVVIVLHGGGGNARNAERMTGFTDLVDRERVLVVYPEGTSRRGGGLLTWNAGHCCGHAMTAQVDDIAFLRAIVDRLAQLLPIDEKRIYVAGMSNGAMLAHRAGREMGDRVAAIASVVGGLFGDEPPARDPVAALMINGMRDRAVPPDGGTPRGRVPDAFDGTPLVSNLAQAQYWAATNGCVPEPSKDESTARVVRWRFACARGRAVELVQLTAGGHAWPGGRPGSMAGDRPSRDLDATAEIWAFFKANPKP